MQDSRKHTLTLEKLMDDSKKELSINPDAATGKCVISSSGYSDCKDGITKEACYKQKDYGYTVKWYIGESC